MNYNLLDFYREIVNSEKSFGIDYKNLSKQLIERIDKAIEYIEKYRNDKTNNLDRRLEKLLEILGGE